ncbi:MAG: cytochrome c oxidase subunit II [Telluria sp.]
MTWPLQDALAPHGPQSEHIYWLWNVTLGLCTVVFVAIVAAFAYALWRAPRGSAQTAADTTSLRHPEHRIYRTVGWAVGLSVAGLIVLLVADVLTSRALAQLPLKDAVNIELVGHQWWWEANYEFEDPSKRFTTANELHIPVGRAVVITLKSNDVIHTLWVPSLHGKKDLIPGRTALIRLRADQPGVYRGQCAEFCGLEHAMMALLVIAEPQDQYDAWVARQRGEAPAPATVLAQRGQEVFMRNTCVMCHTIQGTQAGARTGPDLTHFASRTTLAAGMFPNNRGHLAGWIANAPTMKPGVAMPSNILQPDDLQALLAYMETLR